MTRFHKFAVPVMIVAFAVITIAIMATQDPRLSVWPVVMVGLFSALICVPLIWFSARLKHVSIDEQFLYIEHGNDEEKIRQLHRRGKTNKLDQTFPVTIRLTATAAIREDMFIPKCKA